LFERPKKLQITVKIVDFLQILNRMMESQNYSIHQ